MFVSLFSAADCFDAARLSLVYSDQRRAVCSAQALPQESRRRPRWTVARRALAAEAQVQRRQGLPLAQQRVRLLSVRRRSESRQG